MLNITQLLNIHSKNSDSADVSRPKENLKEEFNITQFGPHKDLFDKKGNRVFVFENGKYVRVKKDGQADNYREEMKKFNEKLQEKFDK